MVFSGTRVSAPPMAAANGMTDIALRQATNRMVQPLMEQMAAPSPAGVTDHRAGRAAGALPGGLTELAQGMLPSPPDLVPFPDLPPMRLTSFTGRLPASAGAPPQPLASGMPQLPAGAAPQIPGAASQASRIPEAATAAAAVPRTEAPKVPGAADAPPASPEEAAAEALAEKTRRPGKSRRTDG
ncbi:hypothetical protein [Inquilinus limosus]|uniref:hypothetical protein n=1 Tax=Inquilinus limosus TaxID=171674 RepID=UPI0012DCF981|nr:hypothetical protein [Inquilinus limosus]